MPLRKGSLLDPPENRGAVYTDDTKNVAGCHPLIQICEPLYRRCRHTRLFYSLRTWRTRCRSFKAQGQLLRAPLTVRTAIGCASTLGYFGDPCCHYGVWRLLHAGRRNAGPIWNHLNTRRARCGAHRVSDHRRARNPPDPEIRCNSQGATPSGESNEFHPTRMLQVPNQQAVAEARATRRAATSVVSPVPPSRSSGARFQVGSPKQAVSNLDTAQLCAASFGCPHEPRRLRTFVSYQK